MIMFKKTHAEQLLQLALTLSLLRVNPDNYLGFGWQSQLALNNGDGWQLELQAAPVSDFPYSNRKALIPLIEDLVRFDRYRHTSSHDIQTYLLNIQNEQANVENNQQSLNNESTISIQENRNFTEHIVPGHNELDLFLNPEHFTNSISVLDQNLADLNDYGDQSFATFPYAGFPLKDEPPDINNYPFGIKQEPSTSFTSDFGSLNSSSLSDNSNYTKVIKWSDYFEDNENAPPFIKFEVKEETDDEKNETKTVFDDDSTSGVSSSVESSVELTEEESEIVEVLWKQDVDLGYSLAPLKLASQTDIKSVNSNANNADDEDEKLKALQELKNEKKDEQKDELNDEWAGIQFTIDNETGEYIQLPLQLDEILQDVLHLADLTSDDPEEEVHSEKSNRDSSNQNIDATTKIKTEVKTEVSPFSELGISTELSLINLEDANELDEFDMMIQSAGPFQHPRSSQNYGHGANTYRQSYHHQSRVPLSRAVSMEQRLQDIAHLFNPIPGMGVGMGVGDMASYPHYPSHYSYQSTGPIPQHGQFTHPHSHAVLHNASLAELGAPQPHYGPNLGTAVSSSMHITNASHEADAGATGYKMDHDMMYYSNASSELNHTTDGFINSILNDEDLQLMDMGVNEGFYTMRMLEPNTTSNNSSVLGGASGGGGHTNGLLATSMQTSIGSLNAIGSTGDRLDASSDSAVSSMGSERVPSLSDGEWGDAGSDSAQDFHQRNSNKYGGPYDYSYSSRLGDTARHPVAQKKHHMFGKRYFQEQSNLPSLPQSASQQPEIPVKYEYEPYGMQHTPSLSHNLEGATGPIVHKQLSQPEMKYSCSLDFARQNRGVHDIVNHNHTYTLPQGTGASPRPQARDKKQRRHDDEHLSRDEKRARALNIPMAVQEIINLPMDEFNERLSKYDLSETQLSLIRDIRRRGKNKVAAQNCRKRKLDQIICLADEVNEVKKRKDRLCNEREIAIAAKKNIMYKFSLLHKHIFQNLRDPDGNPYSQTQYSLQQSVDGSIFLLPKENKDGSNSTSNHNNQQGPSHHHPHHHHQKE